MQSCNWPIFIHWKSNTTLGKNIKIHLITLDTTNMIHIYCASISNKFKGSKLYCATTPIPITTKLSMAVSNWLPCTQRHCTRTMCYSSKPTTMDSCIVDYWLIITFFVGSLDWTSRVACTWISSSTLTQKSTTWLATTTVDSWNLICFLSSIESRKCNFSFVVFSRSSCNLGHKHIIMFLIWLVK